MQESISSGRRMIGGGGGSDAPAASVIIVEVETADEEVEAPSSSSSSSMFSRNGGLESASSFSLSTSCALVGRAGLASSSRPPAFVPDGETSGALGEEFIVDFFFFLATSISKVSERQRERGQKKNDLDDDEREREKNTTSFFTTPSPRRCQKTTQKLSFAV